MLSAGLIAPDTAGRPAALHFPVIRRAARIDLPPASSQPLAPQPAHVDVSITADGAVLWDDKPVDNAALRARIAQAAQSSPQPELHLNADRKVAYEKVADLVPAAPAAGLARIGFITQPDRRQRAKRNGHDAGHVPPARIAFCAAQSKRPSSKDEGLFWCALGAFGRHDRTLLSNEQHRSLHATAVVNTDSASDPIRLAEIAAMKLRTGNAFAKGFQYIPAHPRIQAIAH
jgi:biopolymer transport protein ExbD